MSSLSTHNNPTTNHKPETTNWKLLPEKLLHIFLPELDIGGIAAGCDIRLCASKHALYQYPHLLFVEGRAGLNSLLPRHGTGQLLPSGEFHVAVEMLELLQQIFQDRFFITLSDIRRGALDDKAVFSEGLDL